MPKGTDGDKMKRFIKSFLKNIADFILINISVAFAIVLKFDFRLSAFDDYVFDFLFGIPILTVSYFGMMLLLRTHRILWQFAGVRDRTEFAFFVAAANVPYIIIHALLTGGYPASIYIISAIIMLMALLVLRTAYKVLYKFRTRKEGRSFLAKDKHNVMIIGAGSAGNMLLHDIVNNPQMREYRAACFIDDDPLKIGRSLGRVKVVGDTSTIAANAAKYNISVIIFAIPSCPPGRKAEILGICSKTEKPVKTIPSVNQMVDGRVTMNNIRDIQVEDLLGREPVELDLQRVRDYVAGRVVMVTGGGGSIGSELCRQIASYSPRRLIIFDIYENSVYDIVNELKWNNPSLELTALIGSVRDSGRVEAVLAAYRPDVIYHAAAHKHVPLMEDSPHEAVKNNVFGTYNMVRAADKFGIGRFIMISTDKAVNPTNVMGATKRICEMIIQSYARRSKTEFAAVRFGNVLGSNGSVIPLFKKQIEKGGPVTVTDPEITRFFMTIPEAVSLVLDAGADAKGGEIFILDMGKPVKILTLAENLIQLSGLAPYKDIQIKFTGLRPGEKLYEEVLMDEEGLQKTNNSLISVGRPIEFDEDEFQRKLAELAEAVKNDESDIRALIAGIVRTYRNPENGK